MDPVQLNDSSADVTQPYAKFKLSPKFLEQYRDRKPPFGFEPLGAIVYYRTYSRIKQDGSNEEWWETIQRVVEGTYNMQKRWIEQHGLGWNPWRAQKSAQEMYDRIYNMKFLPPGRGLWAMGSPMTEERGLFACLNNCFAGDTEISTKYGIKRIGDCAGTEQEVATRGGLYVTAPIRSFGKQKLMKLTLKRQRVEKVIYATPEHRWFAKSSPEGRKFSEYLTRELKPGCILEGAIRSQRRWVVASVEETDRVEEVYCATVEGTHCFALADNILTGNCAFVSTKDLASDLETPFTFLMDASMLGIGVGFDVKGAETLIVKGVTGHASRKFIIPDTREGWVESVGALIRSHFLGEQAWEFDYSQIRPAGEPIKGFGGIASGPGPLQVLHLEIERVLLDNRSAPITVRTIMDLMNMIGKCVVAGNVRRTAEIAMGSPFSEEFLDLKNYAVNPERASYGWTSNNTVFCDLGMDYSSVASRTVNNGEPGYAWLHNMQAYSRMNNGPDWKDIRVDGTNPCFSGDTLIAVADGRGAVRIQDLAEAGLDVPVYSVDQDGMVEIQWGRNPRVTGTGEKLLRVTLDDGSHLDVTPNHKMRLRDGGIVEARDLKKGDSLSRFTKFSQEMTNTRGNDYLYIVTDTLNPQKKGSRVGEHRLVYQFHRRDEWDAAYNNEKRSGWVKGGVIIHHKDYNQKNNSIDNLELMSFRDHTEYHANRDTFGEDNGMYGKKHSDETKAKIGQKSKDRWADDGFRKKVMEAAHTQENRELYSKNAKKMIAARLEGYYREQEASTDLKTTRIDGQLYAVKTCETCGVEFTVPWRSRERAFCGMKCSNQYLANLEYRKDRQREVFAKASEAKLHDQIKVYKDLEGDYGRPPLKKEWEARCREIGVPFRINKHSTNPNILKSYESLKELAATYNHRVVSVVELPGTHTVYNITVDKNHTVAIALTFDTDSKSINGIFTMNCGEQSLESKELCCLVECFPTRHDTKEDFLRTLKFAYLYAKTVTLGKTHWPETNRVMLRNRRIGCSMSGVAQFKEERGIKELQDWCEAGYDTIQYYDEIYSDWLAIPRSKKTTSVKPSGTVSKLCGVWPGVHYMSDNYFIQRVRLAKTSYLVKILQDAGYHIEPCVGQEESTVVVEIPLSIGDKVRTLKDVSMWEQLALAAFMQRHWADNQVSVTISFDPEREGPDIANALNFYQYQLKSVSFLPILPQGAFPQMPYEPITKEVYERLTRNLKECDFSIVIDEEAQQELYCNNDSCSLDT